ncbi:hypothetical protein QG37_07273 [Candidozyma auris]|nr:hypothetical protein QG37_07273 [[Candida] auris]
MFTFFMSRDVFMICLGLASAWSSVLGPCRSKGLTAQNDTQGNASALTIMRNVLLYAETV